MDTVAVTHTGMTLLYFLFVVACCMVRSTGSSPCFFPLAASVLKGLLILELMDYPESDEESGTKADDLASGTAILDIDDMDTGSSALPEASWSMSGGSLSASVPPLGSTGIGSAP